MTTQELRQKLFSGYLIKLTGGVYTVVPEEGTEGPTEEITEKLFKSIPTDIVEKNSRSTYYCLDVSANSHEITHGR